jgi:hypothetical protein
VGEFLLLLLIGVAVVIVLAVVFAPDNQKTDSNGLTAMDIALHGAASPNHVCPHCHTRGQVMTKPISRKAGVSGAKATGALLTGGVSLLATGLSRKEKVTEAHCKNCGSTWHF